MICLELEQHLDSYLDREIAADTAAAIREHLRTCLSCRQRVADREAVGRLVRSMPYYEAPDRLHRHLSTRVRRTHHNLPQGKASSERFDAPDTTTTTRRDATRQERI